ncbi:SDR family NAD(P)-dependent oxidoreductase [Rudanella paleaurantiibacter]|uniref:SDR family NAD(P)-dependent oxidoreductase n=1 Tax=Rudanella paleaurantiibacter TaxID=2614655 RepID=A0A7J5TTR9_9BACT|nr:SDR family NAD(P)-dependent oxidoreductase [Rudanella paleaurantiibacter]KAB7727267.1 SDR family NAD(P)-dependent oxidoreductase [Rudanella paleaurantiibacter]
MTLSENEKKRLRNRYGSWAVVTGASSGIGRELAKQLASASFGLVLVARREAVLAEVARELQQTYQTEVRLVLADLAQPEGVTLLIQATESLPVGLLVASAGFGTSGRLVDSDLEDEVNMLRVNCEALLRLTHQFGRRFTSEGRGGIILLSSMVAFQGVPFAAHYAATKAYVQTLAEGLNRELKPAGVDVLAAAPGPVQSGFGSRANMQMNMTSQPAQVGVPILKALGRQTTVLPGWLTKLLVYSLQLVPRPVKVRIMEQVMGGMTRHQRVSTLSI